MYHKECELLKNQTKFAIILYYIILNKKIERTNELINWIGISLFCVVLNFSFRRVSSSFLSSLCLSVKPKFRRSIIWEFTHSAVDTTDPSTQLLLTHCTKQCWWKDIGWWKEEREHIETYCIQLLIIKYKKIIQLIKS